MPSGLDGNPNPIRSAARDLVIAEVVAAIERLADIPYRLVGVDGASAAGKSTVADEVASALRSRGVVTFRSTTDSFHRPREARLRLGKDSAAGYYRDSHDLRKIQSRLLDPFLDGKPFRRAAFDEPSDCPVDAPFEVAPRQSALLFDGLFLHRPELRGYWHHSVLLRADERIAQRRQAFIARDRPPGEAGVAHDQMWQARLNRYVQGWELYENECEPAKVASMVIDNNELESPLIGECGD